MFQAKPWLTISFILAAVTFGFADPVDDFVAKEMALQHIPGLTIGVLQGDKLVRVQGYGLADVESQTPATEDTRYEIGSITKQFTATAIMMLVEDGKIHLDDPISQYIPESPLSWKDITIRQLLNHTAGLTNFNTEWPATSTEPNGGHYAALAQIINAPLEFVPGAKWSYSNDGYYLLGIIFERVSHMAYEDFLKQKFFQPLNMGSTGTGNFLGVNVAKGYAVGQTGWTPAKFDFDRYFSAGDITSSVKDFAKWAVALNDGKFLKRQSYDDMYAPAKLNDGTPRHYGFGWYLANVRGHSEISHDGAAYGFDSDFVRWPKDGLSVIVFTNGGYTDSDRIARGISGLYDPELLPFFLMPAKECPIPELAEEAKELIGQLANGDVSGDLSTEGFKKSMTVNTAAKVASFKEFALHGRDLQYVDRNERRSAYYFRVVRDDGEEYLTLTRYTQ